MNYVSIFLQFMWITCELLQYFFQNRWIHCELIEFENQKQPDSL
jgi:hypothetical protein